MNVREFENILLSQSIETVVKKYVFAGVPHVFNGYPQRLGALRGHLCDRLGTQEQDITIVGSAKIGFSLSPDTFARQFSERSDIDVVVVDQKLFDKAWMTMLKWHYPRKGSDLGTVDNRWVKDRRKDLYWGWFKPDTIRVDTVSFPNNLKALRDLSASWFDAFQSLSLYPAFSDRNISGRLYRTWSHALLYHVDGLKRVRDAVRESRGA